MNELKVNSVVLGAGPGGYVAAIRLAQLGVDTLLVEKEYYGGVCLNVGCIPSKALIHVAKSFESIGKMNDFGITAEAPAIDFSKTQAWKNKLVGQLTGGIKTLVTKNGAKVLEGTGTIMGTNNLRVMAADGSETKVSFENLIIATGSSPIHIPTFPVGKRIIDSTGALGLTEIPKHMTLIGGGYIGLELGFVYRKLGAEVTVVEMMDSVLPGFDKDVVKAMTRKLKKGKFQVLTGAKAKGYQETENGVQLTVEHKGKDLTIDTDYVCVTVGRRPNTGGIGLENAGIHLDDHGFIKIDDQLRTNVPNIFAIGDVAGQPMLAHHASYQGEIAAEVIAGHAAKADAKVCPAVVFTDPEIATVGKSEDEARASGREISVGNFPFAALGKAKAGNDTEGFVKIIADKETEEVLGVVIVGHNAGDLIGEATLGIEMGAFLDDLSLTIHPHPTLTEALMEAAKKAKGHAIHVLN
ncbi:dihydrolipoyl dehydrogenase [Acanthopleuribacter pedis]|uniref:Dihydrolipoyl dehydrogenase n=1 Tax=Acanthopleuribacter pedis TaxID=442870 RepID=A0A8J7U6Z4_9BACT|nr:dihydrolipoyl dehydrogenase [Acanthopleuribacter pedis]MBO1320886.1 dihydrolipoyl dehydrogenase [Acanthopleuribacter pedis]